MKLSVLVFGIFLGLLALSCNVQAQSCDDVNVDPTVANLVCFFSCQFIENCLGGECVDVTEETDIPISKACKCSGCNDGSLVQKSNNLPRKH